MKIIFSDFDFKTKVTPMISSTSPRRKFSGMLYKLDESVGRVVTALASRNMLQDSVIVFTTDNGGPAAGVDINHASNWPLRGVKDTLWEGGVRGASFLWSPRLVRLYLSTDSIYPSHCRLKTAPRVSRQMMNIQDWLPTLLSAAGARSGSVLIETNYG